MKKAIIFLLCLATLKVGFAQWTQISQFYKATVNCFYINGNDILAGTNKGMFLSKDKGKTWTEADNGFDSLSYVFNIDFVFKIGDTIFANCDDGLFYTTDNAQSWSSVYRNADYYTLFLSEETDTLKKIHPTSVLVDGEKLYFATTVGLMMSSDKGYTWKTITTGLTDSLNSIFPNNKCVHLIAGSENNIYVGLDHGGVKILQNGNDVFYDVSYGLPADDLFKEYGWYVPIQALAVVDTIVFVGTEKGIFFSEDNCKSWTPVEKGLVEDYKVGYYWMSFVTKGSKLFLIINGNLYLTEDYGATWHLLISSHNVASVGFVDNYLYVGTGTFGIWRCAEDSLLNYQNSNLKIRTFPTQEDILSHIPSVSVNNNNTKIYRQILLLEYNFNKDTVVVLKKDKGKNIEGGVKLPVIVNSTVGDSYMMGKFSNLSYHYIKNRILPELDSSTFLDFVIKNKIKESIDKIDIQGCTVNYIDTLRLSKLMKRGQKSLNDFWIKLEKMYPNTDGYIEFSRIGYNKNQTQALIYFGESSGPLSGYGALLLFELINGRWVNVGSMDLWQS